jgi:hypothetical protein
MRTVDIDAKGVAARRRGEGCAFSLSFGYRNAFGESGFENPTSRKRYNPRKEHAQK